MAAAVLDRILHHCTVVNVRGESYRLKDRRKNALITMWNQWLNEDKYKYRWGILLGQFWIFFNEHLQ